jgi:hypothetical protein
MRALAILTPALLMIMCGCAQQSSGAPSTSGGDSGIQGTTTVDSGSPIVYSTPRPRRPLAARLLISPQRVDTAAAITAESDAQGRFRVPLAPGTYTVHPENLTGAPVPTARPTTVTVHPGTWTDLDIQFDSGIR